MPSAKGEKRRVVLAAKTTGLNIGGSNTDRIFEIAAIEIDSQGNAVKALSYRVNPRRGIPDVIAARHGVIQDQVPSWPTFRKIARRFAKFVGGAELIAQNTDFLLPFINQELAICGLLQLGSMGCTTVNVGQIVRTMHSEVRTTLDSLCELYAVPCPPRIASALECAESLAKVYVAMARERKATRIPAKPSRIG